MRTSILLVITLSAAGDCLVAQFSPCPPTNLDSRRSAVGMPPMRQYVCLLEEEGMRVDQTSLPATFRP